LPSGKDPPERPDKDEVRKRLAEKLWSVLDQREKTKQVLDRLGWYSPTHPVEALRNNQVLRQYYERTFPKEERIRKQIAQLQPVPSSSKKRERRSSIPKKPAHRRVTSAKLKYIRFKKSGGRVIAEPGFTHQQLLNTYNMLVATFKEVRTYVLQIREKPVSIAELKKRFPQLSPFSNDEQLQGWVEDFTAKATPKGVALVYLEKTTGSRRSTITTYLSHARGTRKRKN
jgi:hypothetical protein